MNKITVMGLTALCLIPLAFPIFFASTDEFPAWAYPVDLPPGPGPRPAQAPKDDGAPLHVPDSDAAFTRAEIEGASVADWHPGDHPEMPNIVKNGREGLRACAYCHQPNGAGRPDNASLAGLTGNYIREQIGNFKKGFRKGAAPDRAQHAQMEKVAAALTDDELAEAVAYFSTLKLASYVKVVESDTAPKTVVVDGLLMKAPDGEMEPLGQRIVEVPEDSERARNRDPRTAYIAYVPKGSLAKGKAFVTGGATPCIACHGPDLHGVGDIPHIGGRSPSYIVRQLYDIKTGKRTGNIAPMQGVVSALEINDMIAIAAYVASQEP
jgi:cytochrome c553